MAKKNVKNERGFKGIWIPREVWLDDSLTLTEKIVFIEIDSLDNDDGCYASNQHFADFLSLSVPRVQKIIASLSTKGLIDVVVDRSVKNVARRVIHSLVSYRKQHDGHVGNDTTRHVGNDTCINTEINNTVEIYSSGADAAGVAEVIKAFIDAGSKISYGNKTQRAAASRLIAKFGLEQTLVKSAAAIKLNTFPFAPRTYTPYELELNHQKIRDFIDRERKKSNKLAVTIAV